MRFELWMPVGEPMQAAAEASPSTMISVLGMETEAVEGLCDEYRGGGTLRVANYLCPKNIVISGDTDACRAAAQGAEAAGAMKTIELPVAGAFHTALMEPAVEKVAAVLAEVSVNSPRITVISNVDAQSHSDPDEIRSLLGQQICSPVLWEKSVRALLADGVDDLYEIGPGRVLRGLMKRIDRKVKCQKH